MLLELGIMHSHDAKAGNARYSAKKEGLSSVLSDSIGAGDKGRYVFVSVNLLHGSKAMLHDSLSASKIGAPLALAALLACVTPAGARIALNGISMNGTSMNGLAMNGSALGDLNGVAVESVVIPEAAIR